MLIEKIDLYSYFNLPKREGQAGILTTYVLENNPETGLSRKRSAILVIPGGAYAMVSAREAESVALAYLSHGISAFVLDYSVAPNSSYPTQLREAAMAMIYIRENAKKYHIDPETVGAIGFSAGGHLCGCLGTLFNSPDLQDLRNCDFARPSAIILSYPVTVSTEGKTHAGSFDNVTANNDELRNKLSLDNCVTKFSSPAFIWHTMNDPAVPLYGSLVLAQKYNELQIPFELHVFEDGAHGLSIATDEVNSRNDAVAVWVNLSVTWLKQRGFIIYS